MTDQDYLKRATEIGNKKAEPYNFGTVIVKDGEIIGEDYNHVHETNNPTAHAEISAIRMATQKIGSHNLGGATMYGSHEPCVMCLTCAAWAGVNRVVYAVPATEQSLRYELKDMTLQEFSKQLQNREITIEHVTIES